MEKTVIQCFVVARDISGQPHTRWTELVYPNSVMWEEVISDLEILNTISCPQIEYTECKLKDLVTQQTFEHVWVEVPEQAPQFMPFPLFQNRSDGDDGSERPGQYV